MIAAGFTVLLFFISVPMLAQDRTLKEVRIKHKKQNAHKLNDERLNSFTPGMKILTIDSQLMAQYALQNLGQLLTQQAPVFIKSYGMNSLATLNFRGSSAAQSQVLWNGIPLNNASLGMADVSLLGVQNFDQINIAYGSSSALLGSGNVGAALLLDNQFERKDSTKQWRSNIGAEAASFGQYKMALKETYSTPNLLITTRLMGQTAQNNFSFTDQSGLQQKMSNARLSAYSGMLNMAYHFDSKTEMNAAVWYQHFDREIPPALFEQFSVKEQKDAALRLFLAFKKDLSEKDKVYSKTAFMEDGMHYSDSAATLVTQNKTYQFYEELGWKKQLSEKQELLLFIPVNISWMRPQNDSQTRAQYKTALAAAYKYSTFQNRLNISASTRLEQINKQTVFLPGLNASYQLFDVLALRVNVQRSYRAPTLNEWYYVPGGNINLKPERGWSEDAGYELKLPLGSGVILNHDLSVFNRNINDWILWFGGSVWTPHNIARVHSRGVETINSLLWKAGDWKFQLGLNTSFVLATTSQSYLPNDGSIGKQIPYSPRYNGQINAGFSFKKISLRYNHTYTGYRFITTDESQFLKPYQTGNIYIAYALQVRTAQWRISFQANNLWNEQYQVVNLRPMPGRNIAVGLNVSL